MNRHEEAKTESDLEPSGQLHLENPQCPPELEEAIFKLAAWDDQRTGLALLYVARRAKVWIEPVVYRVVCLTQRHQFEAFCESVKGRDIRARVLAASVTCGADGQQLRTILDLLPCLESFKCIQTWWDHPVALLEAIWDTPRALKSLAAPIWDSSWTFPPSNSFPFSSPAAFPNLTHLDINGSYSPAAVSLLTRLPNLTHIAVSTFFEYDVVRLCLQSLERLRVFVVLEVLSSWGPVLQSEHWDDGIKDVVQARALANDPRVCFISGDINEYWRSEAWGYESFWSLAEAAVERNHQESSSGTERSRTWDIVGFELVDAPSAGYWASYTQRHWTMFTSAPNTASWSGGGWGTPPQETSPENPRWSANENEERQSIGQELDEVHERDGREEVELQWREEARQEGVEQDEQNGHLRA